MRAHRYLHARASVRRLWTMLLTAAPAIALSACITGNKAVDPPMDIHSARRAFDACEGMNGVGYEPRSRTICVRGAIDPALGEDFEAVWNAHAAEAEQLVLSGPGGQLTPALDMAELMLTAPKPVIVGDPCISSCAQFLFVAGETKFVLSGGFVGFHGGPLSDDQIVAAADDEPSREFLRAENARFREFYQRLGISMDMLTRPPASVQAEINEGRIIFWTWNAAELESFGVHGVIAE